MVPHIAPTVCGGRTVHTAENNIIPCAVRNRSLIGAVVVAVCHACPSIGTGGAVEKIHGKTGVGGCPIGIGDKIEGVCVGGA